VVGMRLDVRSNNVDLLHLIVKTLQPDGTLTNKRTIVANGSGSGNEINFEAPGNSILTGIGLRVRNSNANRAQFFHREISLDEEDCQYKFGPERETFIGSQGDLEQSYKLTEDYDDKVACIQGVSIGVRDDRVNILQLEVGELKLD
ncbi:MAG: hypothetical protein AAFV78_14170, partial [Bacteroidota bacterium]